MGFHRGLGGQRAWLASLAAPPTLPQGTCSLSGALSTLPCSSRKESTRRSQAFTKQPQACLLMLTMSSALRRPCSLHRGLPVEKGSNHSCAVCAPSPPSQDVPCKQWCVDSIWPAPLGSVGGPPREPSLQDLPSPLLSAF